MGKKVLLLSTSAGSGHKAAAAALHAALETSHEVYQIVNQDALELTNAAFRSFYADLYLKLVKENPLFVGWWYRSSDEPFKTDSMRLLLDRLSAEPLVRFIRELNPDITVCTHFMPAGIVAQMLARNKLRTTLSIVTTDYDFHSMWLSAAFNRYFVALPETRAHLVALGLPAERITVSGIPVHPRFATPIDRAATLARHGLCDDMPIVLASAGAVGGGPWLAIVTQLLQLSAPAQIVVVCGRNEALRHELLALTASQRERFSILGYADDMAELMKVAALFIGKPGGLTASEAMACGLPMAIVDPIPGQEERNADHLLEQGVAIRCNIMQTLAFKIDALLGDAARLALMRANATRLGRPGAAHEIARAILDERGSPLTIDAELQQQIVAASRSP